MVLIVLGFIGFLISIFILQRSEIQKIAALVSMISKLSLFVFLLGIVLACFVQVDTGKIGVKTLFGKVEDDYLESGLHFINPLLIIKELDTRTYNYTMSNVHDEGDKMGDDAIRVLTSDGLEVTLDLTVLFRIIPSEGPRLLRETGADFVNKIVRPLTRTKIRDNAVYYEAVSLFSGKRDEFQNKIFKSIEKDFTSRGLILEQLLIRNITLPSRVKTAIEDKISAEQDADKMQFILRKEKQEAERKRIEALGIAEYQKIIASGLTEKQLIYEQIKAQKELAQSQNAKIVIMGKSNTPLILDTKN